MPRFALSFLAALLIAGCLPQGGDEPVFGYTQGCAVCGVKTYPRASHPPESLVAQRLLLYPFKEAGDTTEERTLPEPYTAPEAALCIVTQQKFRIRYRVVDTAGTVLFKGSADFGYWGEMHDAGRRRTGGYEGCAVWPLWKSSEQAKLHRKAPGYFFWQAELDFEPPQTDVAVERIFPIRETW